MSDDVEDGAIQDLELRIEHLEAQCDAHEARAKALQKMLDARDKEMVLAPRSLIKEAADWIWGDEDPSGIHKRLYQLIGETPT